MDPTWDPRGNLLMYARDGGSFSNLILANPRTGNRKRLTDNESAAEVGSPEYVEGSYWALDPFWSAADIVCYISDVDTTFREMALWILLPDDNYAYLAASDGSDLGPLENPAVDAGANFCVYTVLSAGGAEGGTTYVSLRDLNMGTTYPIIEGPQGAYDPAISPDSAWIVASLRDESGTSDLWLFDRVNETLSRLTNDEQASNATFSPDGEWIAYLRREGTNFALRALRIDPQSGEREGDAVTLVGADTIDTTSGLSWVGER
jgi:WD40 repeat protein